MLTSGRDDTTLRDIQDIKIMQWLIANWFWVLIGVAFVGMHLFGHGGHGGHGGGHRHGSGAEDPGSRDGVSSDANRNADHQH
jgi:hypothetical protein